jgi:tetratricopeptide (TPR) repeat protein
LAIELVAYRAEGDATLAELWAEWQRLGGALAARPGVDPSRLTSLPHSIDLSLQSRRLGEDGKRLFRLLGQLPAGIARDDRIALFGEAAARAGEELRSVGLAIVRGDRLDLLPPIRDHASRHYPPEGDDDARWRAHYLGLLDEIASPGAPVGRLVPEFANLEEAIREQLQRGLQVGATPTVHGLSVLMRLAGLGPVSLIERLAAARSDAGDALGAANCVHMAGEVALARSDHDAARDAYDRALPLYRQVGDILGEANCIKSLGDIALARSDHDAARDAYRRAQPLYRQVGDILGEANCIRSLGDIARERSDREAARDAYDRALSLYRQVGDILGEANCIKRLGDIAFDRSDREAARDAYDRALPLYRQVGDILGEANCIRSLGDIALARSNHDAARLNYLEALALYERIAEPYSVGRAHLALIPITGGTERAAHIAAARAAWMSIGRADLVEKLLPPDT